MAVNKESRINIGDYVAFKDIPNMIFKVMFINYIDDRISLKIIYPEDSQESYKVMSFKLSGNLLIKIPKTGTVSVLYDK